MPDSSSGSNPPQQAPESKNALVFSAPAAALTDAQIKELQDKFGVTLHLQTNSNAVSRAIGQLAQDAVQNFDRTNPGYDRGFDRTGDSGNFGQQVINPVDLQAQIQSVASRILAERQGGGS